MIPEQDPHDMDEPPDDSEERFIVDCLKECFCCDECAAQRPCAGVMAGGVCDRMCHCPNDEGFDEDDDDIGF